jgi:ornithine cyclodeaminase/alanine dehydrogenase-like protein (mu-crystallin family)
VVRDFEGRVQLLSQKIQARSASDVEETFPSIRRGEEIIYLTRADVERCGGGEAAIMARVRAALTAHGLKKCEMPAKIGLHPLANTLMHAMPAFVAPEQACGMKWAECFPENHKYGLLQTSGLLVLNDVQTGWPVAVMDAIWITAVRTPAVSALAVEKLARADSRVAAVLGCGVQGRGHVSVLPRVAKKLEEVRVFDIRTEAAESLVDDLAEGYPCRLARSLSIEELVRDADIVITATAILTRPDPQVRDSWIKPGALLLPVDFDSVFEWETMHRADKFLVDSVDEMKYFMGIGYLRHGLPPVHAELGEVVAGLKPGRENDAELIMDMNIGMGVEDVVIAKDVLTRALEEGVGMRLPL